MERTNSLKIEYHLTFLHKKAKKIREYKQPTSNKVLPKAVRTDLHKIETLKLKPANAC